MVWQKRLEVLHRARLFSSCCVDPRKVTVAVGMSGGVDSSVAAFLLKKQNFNVVGIYMQNWDDSDETGEIACPALKEFEDAKLVCEQLDIPIEKVNFVKPYWNNVFEPFLEDYSQGLTPNPDVACNREIKFDLLQKFALDRGADYIATGHYARLEHGDPLSPDTALHWHTRPSTPSKLFMGVDRNKDQSYFLSCVPGTSLSKAMFPVGGMLKPEVRQVAAAAGLLTARKAESYGICFIGKRRFPEFLSSYLPLTEGRFVSDQGIDLGPHNGAELYTVGQNARIAGAPQKHFVAGKCDDGSVMVVPGTNHPALFCDSAEVDFSNFSWVAGSPPAALLSAGGTGLRLSYRVRHRQPLGFGRVSVKPASECPSTSSAAAAAPVLHIEFELPQRAVALGQVLVLYDGEECLGGGPLTGRGPSYHEIGKEMPATVPDWSTS